MGIISLLWNAMGAMDFTMSNLQTESYMAQLNEAQTAFFAGFPLWARISWGIAVFGAVLGSVLILLRNKLAVPVFLAALLALLITSLHNFVLSGIKMSDIASTGAMIFTAVIFLVAVLLLLYSKAQANWPFNVAHLHHTAPSPRQHPPFRPNQTYPLNFEAKALYK